MSDDLEGLATRAKAGDKAALEAVVLGVKDDVYGLALRMLWKADDAEDATQEILIKVITHLGTFRGESSLRTWVHRVAANHLMNLRRGWAELQGLSFERFGAMLSQGLADPAPGPDQGLLEEEVKVGCTTGMLLCLDREHRMAFIIGEILGFDGVEAAQILEIEPAAFRKRLQRAREGLRAFMQGHCGLVNPQAPCRCARRIRAATEIGLVTPSRLTFAGHPIHVRIEELHELHRTTAIYRSHPRYAAPGSLVRRVREMLDSGRYSVLQ